MLGVVHPRPVLPSTFILEPIFFALLLTEALWSSAYSVEREAPPEVVGEVE